ncbi:hypothetical protein BDN67DRAFT_1017880 [Paxillus ammoniavirescens]|nr:hypothetical protein BDN67DRAFT_1017880 [Paxillus ammoniavirescens]
MAAQQLDVQQQVYAVYWRVRSAFAKLILEIEHVVFNRRILDDELSPAWDVVFNKGRTDLNFLMHLLNIIIKLKPAADNSTLQGINVAGILPDDPQARQSKVYIKGYTIANNAVTPNLPIANNRWWDPFHQCYAAALMQNTEWEQLTKEKEAAAMLQAAADELLQKKMVQAEEEQRKAGEMRKKGAGSRAKKQGEKQVEKRRRRAEAEDSEPLEEDAGEERGRQATRGISSSAGPSRARTASQASKRFKWTPSEEDSQHRTDKEEGNDPNLLDAFYHLDKEDWLQHTQRFPEIKTAKGKVLQSADALQEQGMRVRPATKAKRPECSKSQSGHQIGRPGVAAAEDVQMHSPKGPKTVKAKTKAKQTLPSPDDMDEDTPSSGEPEALQEKGHKVTKAKGKGKARQPSLSAMDEDPSSEESEPLGEVFVPWVDKGKGRDIPPASGVPGPSAAEVDVVERHTTILVDQLTKQLADMRSWETASNEMDQMADAEDLEWDRHLANMDELLRESHARHVALKARLAESEQERMVMMAESAQARMMITNLRSMYTGMSQFLQFNSTVGGPGGVPPSALGGQAGLSQ